MLAPTSGEGCGAGKDGDAGEKTLWDDAEHAAVDGYVHENTYSLHLLYNLVDFLNKQRE